MCIAAKKRIVLLQIPSNCYPLRHLFAVDVRKGYSTGKESKLEACQLIMIAILIAMTVELHVVAVGVG